MPNEVPTRVLAALGIRGSAFLGSGGEAEVYALDERRVARIHRRGTSDTHVRRRVALLEELARGAEALPFAIPSVVDVEAVADRLVTIETRLPGRALSSILRDSPARRQSLIRAYLDAADRIGDIALSRSAYGEIASPEPIRTRTFRAYLQRRAERSLAGAEAAFAAVDPAGLAAALPEPKHASLVHLDVFPGNVLADADAITAVIDFGSTCIVGDRRLDPLAAAAYLDSPISPEATAADRRTAREWLAEHSLLELDGPARRWLGAYWSRAGDHPQLIEWCRGLLFPATDVGSG